MMKIKRTPLFIIAVVVIITAWFLSGFFPKSCKSPPQLGVLTTAERQTGVAYITDNYKAPEEFVIEQFEKKDIVFLGEFGIPNYTWIGLRQNVAVVKKLIPLMNKRGIKVLAIEHVLADDQKDIDEILSADEFDELKAKQLLSRRSPVFLFQDYVELFREAWTVNRIKEPNEIPFRIIGLNLKMDIVALLASFSPEDSAKAFQGQVQEEYMFSVINKEIIDKKQKALVFLNILNCLKQDVLFDRQEFYNEIGLDYTGSVAKLTVDKIGTDAMVILLHNLWANNENDLAFPINGYFDALIHDLPKRVHNTGFLLEGSPFGKLDIINCFIGPNQPAVQLDEICDAYIIQGPLSYYTVSQMFSDTITEENMNEIKIIMQIQDDDVKNPEEVAAIVLKLEDYDQYFLELPK